jgi:hypothetical protein
MASRAQPRNIRRIRKGRGPDFRISRTGTGGRHPDHVTGFVIRPDFVILIATWLPLEIVAQLVPSQIASPLKPARAPRPKLRTTFPHAPSASHTPALCPAGEGTRMSLLQTASCQLPGPG